MAAVMNDWAESETRYDKMAKTDRVAADAYKADVKEKLRATVTALDNEIQDQRAQIDEVHQQRVQAKLNERKREAIRHYRDVLAASLSTPKPADVLPALTAYIRAEEKDRTHSLQRYVHLLKASPSKAAAERAQLLRRLHDIDTRINGTIAMLNDFPTMVEKVRPAALQMWADYRATNTPNTRDSLAVSIGGAGKDERVLALYERAAKADADTIDSVDTDIDGQEQDSGKLSPELMAQIELVSWTRLALHCRSPAWARCSAWRSSWTRRTRRTRSAPSRPSTRNWTRSSRRRSRSRPSTRARRCSPWAPSPCSSWWPWPACSPTDATRAHARDSSR